MMLWRYDNLVLNAEELATLLVALELEIEDDKKRVERLSEAEPKGRETLDVIEHLQYRIEVLGRLKRFFDEDGKDPGTETAEQ